MACVAKPSDIDDFFCFVVNYHDLWMPLKQISTTPFQENYFFRHPQLDPFVKNYCIFNAPMSGTKPGLTFRDGLDLTCS